MKFAATILAAVSMFTFAMAEYNDNCDGSSIPAPADDCAIAIGKIDTSRDYNGEEEFSRNNCYIKYAGHDGDATPVSGQTIKDTAQRIVDTCNDHHGSFGTGNCDKCHVTVNYKS